MVKSYSHDLKVKIISLIESGGKVRALSEKVKIGKSTLYRWLKEKRETGKIVSKKEWRKGHSHKITDLDSFKKFVDKNKGITSIEMAEKWGNISPSCVRSYLHKLKYSRKKRVTGTKKGKKKQGRFICEQ